MSRKLSKSLSGLFSTHSFRRDRKLSEARHRRRLWVLENLEARALLTLINFDNLPAMVPGPGTIPVADRLSNQLGNLGVTFSTGLGADYVPVVGPSDGTSPPNSIWMAAPDNTLVLYEPYYVVIDFVDPADPSSDAVTDFASIRGDVNGSSNTLTMQAFDMNGNLLGTDTQPDTGGETVKLSIPGIQSVHILMSTPTGQSGGIALDDLTFDPPVSAANHLVVTAQPPGSVTAGSGFGLTVKAEDQSGNVLTSFGGTVSVALSNNPGGATLGGTLTATAQDGVASFSGLTLDKAGTGYTLRVSASGLASTATSGFNVTAAAATQLVVTTQPPSDVAPGAGFGLTASAEDPFDNVDPNFGGSVTVALLNNPTGATLGGTLTATAQSGVATFAGLTLNNIGTGYTLQVTGDGLTAAATNAFDVQNAPTLINFDNLPAMVPGPGTIPVADRLSNQLGNQGVIFSTGLGADYVPVVGPSDGTSPPNSIWMAATDNTLVLYEPYYVVIDFVDPADPSVDAVTDFASIRGDVNGSSNTLTMQAYDINGNLLGTDTQPDVGGETVSVSMPGIQSVHILMSTPNGQVGGIGLDDLMFDPPVPAAINHLAVTAQPPASVTAGAGFGLTVTAEDKSGNVLTSFNGTVTVALAVNPGGSTLGGTLTATAQSGVATFSGLTLNKAGTGYTLLVSGEGVASATTDPFDVTAATATQLVVTTQPPGSVLLGSQFGLTVSAEDPFDNVDPTFGGNVSVALLNNPAGAALGGTLSSTAQGGVATFSDLALDHPGIGYTLQVTSSGLTSTTAGPFNVQTTIATVAADWGTQTAPLQTAADGIRLLPAGRSTDLPWLGIDQLPITLAQATTLASGDVTVTGIAVANYGPVTISGSGTNYRITLAQPINKADRVTITIGSAAIATFTRRLDVLPGDFNDDGVVNSQDLVGVRNEWLKVNGATATIFGDLNGDGVVNINDYNIVRAASGTTLPAINAPATAPAATGLVTTTTVGQSSGGKGIAPVVPAAAVSTLSPESDSSPPVNTVSLAPLVTSPSVSVNAAPPPAQTVTISVSVHGSKAARRAAAAEARAMKRAEIRLANRGHRLNLENRRDLGDSTGKELKRL